MAGVGGPIIQPGWDPAVDTPLRINDGQVVVNSRDTTLYFFCKFAGWMRVINGEATTISDFSSAQRIPYAESMAWTLPDEGDKEYWISVVFDAYEGNNSPIATASVNLVEQPTPGAADDNFFPPSRVMKQKAVWWDVDGIDANGQPTHALPVEIDVRWEEVAEEFINSDGDRELSRALLVVDRDVQIKGMIMLGELSSVTEANPKDMEGAWEIRQWKKTPSFNGRKYHREVFL